MGVKRDGTSSVEGKTMRILVINTVEYVISGISTVIMNYFEKIDHEAFQCDFVINGYVENRYLEIMKRYNANMASRQLS